MLWGLPMFRTILSLVFVLGISSARADVPVRQAVLAGGNVYFQPSDKDNENSLGSSFQLQLFSLKETLEVKGWKVKHVLRNDEETSRFSDFILALQEMQSLPAGSQLLIAMNSHGSVSTTKFEHHWAFQDGDYPNNHPDFIAALRTLKDKGIKIGFLDSSCYSGATTRDLAQYACVVAGGSATRTSRGDSVVVMLDEMLRLQPSQINPFSIQTNGSITLDELFLFTLIGYPLRVPGAQQPEITGFTRGNEAADLVVALTADKRGMRDYEDRAGLHYVTLDMDSLKSLLVEMRAELVAQPGSIVKDPIKYIYEFQKLSGRYDKDNFIQRTASQSMYLLPGLIYQSEEARRNIRSDSTPSYYAYGKAFNEMERTLSYMRVRYYLNRKKHGDTSSQCADFVLR